MKSEPIKSRLSLVVIALAVSIMLTLDFFCPSLLVSNANATGPASQSLKTDRGEEGADDEAVDFARDIQPILSDRCYFCHGPDENKRAGGFRLDVEEDALDYIQPGDADSSELIERIFSDDDTEVMPPPAAKFR